MMPAEVLPLLQAMDMHARLLTHLTPLLSPSRLASLTGQLCAPIARTRLSPPSPSPFRMSPEHYYSDHCGLLAFPSYLTLHISKPPLP